MPFRSRALGLVSRVVGGLLLTVAVIGFVLRGSLFGGVLLDVLFSTSGGVGGLLLVLGRRLGAVAADEAMATDPRPPVVYLRSFRADGELSVSHGAMLGFPSENTEQLLTRVLSRVGPVIAIGKPGETLPELGAARMYVGDDQWQHEVDALLDRASLVLLRLGDTEGFWWELERVVGCVPPRKILLLLNWTRSSGDAAGEQTYQAFRTRAQPLFAHELPAALGEACFLAFDDDWTPRLLGSIRKMWQAVYYNKPDFMAAELSEVLGRHGVSVDRPRIVSKGVWIACGVIVLIGVLLAMLMTW